MNVSTLTRAAINSSKVPVSQHASHEQPGRAQTEVVMCRVATVSVTRCLPSQRQQVSARRGIDPHAGQPTSGSRAIR
jgi:hypothetical protein